MGNDTGYPKDTLGYHHAFCKSLFGEESKATKFLEEKAKESPNGMNERVIAAEEQMVYTLSQLHLQGLEDSSEDAKS